MSNKELIKRIFNCFDWWDFDEEQQAEIEEHIENNNIEELKNILKYFEEEQEEKIEIIKELQHRTGVKESEQ